LISWCYNDQQPDTIFYQGLALKKIGKINEANVRFQKLIDYGRSHINDDVKIYYFAVSLPDLAVWEENLNSRNKIHCNYLIALGYFGIGDNETSEMYFKKVTNRDYGHFGANEDLILIQSFKRKAISNFD